MTTATGRDGADATGIATTQDTAVTRGSAAARDTAVAVFGTGYMATRVLRAGPRYLWCRTPGPAREEGFRPVPGPVTEAHSAWAVPGARIVLGTPARTGAGDYGTVPTLEAGEVERRYTVGSPYSLGHVLCNHTAAPSQWAALPALLERTGEVLRRVHTTFDEPHALDEPPGAARLARWLSGRTVTSAAGRLRREALIRLGGARLERAAGWCAELGNGTPTGRGGVLLLGGLALGSVIPDPDGAGCSVLAGEELSTGSAAYDLGWAIGELAEFRLVHFARSGDLDAAGRCADATDALLRGYTEAGRPGPPGPALDDVARAAVLRVLAHSLDYTAFVGWTDRLTGHLDVIAALLDHPMGTIDGLPVTRAGRRTGHKTEEQ
ncbi:hypothetical protein ACGFZR_17755 [Streptomyces sp. NPDC048241]|uniref:hypothetical protein n=1 Tax=Streptomyces sp. NPDC048241 TaxID=3365521 RepID=UPI003719B471